MVGNLFHHAIENALKAFLVQKHDLNVLATRRFGHNLRNLSSEFKKEVADPSQLTAFDDLIG